MHEFSHMIFYVPEVEPLLDFYKRAFDLDHRFIHESGDYAELDTGHTSLAFAAHSLIDSRLPLTPGGFEICLTTPDVSASYERALSEGATSLIPPEEKPWGQTVAYVRDPADLVIAISSPIQ